MGRCWNLPPSTRLPTRVCIIDYVLSNHYRCGNDGEDPILGFRVQKWWCAYTSSIKLLQTSSFVESSRKTDQGSGIMVFKMPQMGLLNFLIQTPPSIKNDDNRHAYICKFFFERTFHWQIQLGIYIYVTILSLKIKMSQASLVSIFPKSTNSYINSDFFNITIWHNK